jgi:hypothetical protein
MFWLCYPSRLPFKSLNSFIAEDLKEGKEDEEILKVKKIKGHDRRLKGKKKFKFKNYKKVQRA